MATLQGIDSSTGISGLDGPCIEAEIFCPVKSKHILQCTQFHIYLDHQSSFFLIFWGWGWKEQFLKYLLQIPADSITKDIADMRKCIVKIIWMKWKTLKILLVCFSEHCQSCRLGVSSVAIPWILLFMCWPYYGQLNKGKKLEKVVVGKGSKLH